MLSWDSIELGFERFIELLRANAAAWSELERSRREFFVDAVAAATPGAERRHLEWFLLERESEALGGAPFLALEGAWRAGLGPQGEEIADAFSGSLAGAFEVTSISLDDGLWVRDLFTKGEHPVLESEACTELAVGDLLVGRLLLAGDGMYLLSPAVWSLRNPAVVEGVRRDLEDLRGARRGSFRVSQLELERLFHVTQVQHALPIDPGGDRERARAALQALGLPRDVQDSVLSEVERGARSGDGSAVTESLNRLAFETDVELDSARQVLAALWETTRLVGTAGLEATTSVEPSPSGAHAALEAFDRGRRDGQDLELLFRTLERDLGVEPDDPASEGEDSGVPDFPGVVGAMVEEFLWETRREFGPERAKAWGVLRHLGLYGREIGVFEELNATQLLDFSARWLLDESGLQSDGEASTLLEALEAFCRWCEDCHDFRLWTQFGSTLAGLRASVPRLLVLRRSVPLDSGAGAFEVLGLSAGAAQVRDERGQELSVPLTPVQADSLRTGDLVRVIQRQDTLELGAGYPREVAQLLWR